MGGDEFGGVLDWATAMLVLLVATGLIGSFFSGSVGGFETDEIDGAGCCGSCLGCSGTLGVAVLAVSFGSSRTTGFGCSLTLGFGPSRTTGGGSTVLVGEA